MAVHLEVERKYDAAPDFVVPDLNDLPGCAAVSEPETHQLTASYFDTDDLRLAALGITLRRRRGGDDAGWHLKMPVGPGTKREIHAPLGRSAKTVPAKLARLVAGYARGRRLRPIARLETHRTVVRLLDKAGDVLAEVADDAVSGHVVDRIVDAAPVSAWREIEIELGQGPPKLLKSAGNRLRKAGARPADSASKLARVLDGRIPARPAPPTRLRTVRDVLTAYVAAQVRTMLDYDPRVRLNEYDSVHKMRVAVRRTRSMLRTYRSVLDGDATAPLDAELKWLADTLGEVRDLEVLHERFAGRLAELTVPGETRGAGTTADTGGAGETGEPPAVPGWLDDLVTRGRAAHRRVTGALTGERYFALLDALEEFCADPPVTAAAGRKADKALPRIVATAWQRVGKALDEAERLPTAEEREAARHRARRVAKRARYTAESAVPVLGSAARDIAAQAERMQEALGGYQDGLIAQEHLTEAAAALLRAGRPAARDAFTLGLLIGIERCDTERARTEVAPAWRLAAKPKYLRALGVTDTG